MSRAASLVREIEAAKQRHAPDAPWSAPSVDPSYLSSARCVRAAERRKHDGA